MTTVDESVNMRRLPVGVTVLAAPGGCESQQGVSRPLTNQFDGDNAGSMDVSPGDPGSQLMPGQFVVRVEVRDVPSWDSRAHREAKSRLADYVTHSNRGRWPRLGYGFGVMVLLFEIDGTSIAEVSDVAREIAAYINLDPNSLDLASLETEGAVLWRRHVFGSGII